MEWALLALGAVGAILAAKAIGARRDETAPEEPTAPPLERSGRKEREEAASTTESIERGLASMPTASQVTAGVAGSALRGAAAGSAIVPVIGTAIGFVVGLFVGIFEGQPPSAEQVIRDSLKSWLREHGKPVTTEYLDFLTHAVLVSACKWPMLVNRRTGQLAVVKGDYAVKNWTEERSTWSRPPEFAPGVTALEKSLIMAPDRHDIHSWGASYVHGLFPRADTLGAYAITFDLGAQRQSYQGTAIIKSFRITGRRKVANWPLPSDTELFRAGWGVAHGGSDNEVAKHLQAMARMLGIID